MTTTQERYPDTPLSRVATCGCEEQRHVEYFCDDHDALFCRTCKYEQHLHCKFHVLKNVVPTKLARLDTQQLMQNLQTIRKVFLRFHENQGLSNLQHRHERRAAESRLYQHDTAVTGDNGHAGAVASNGAHTNGHNGTAAKLWHANKCLSIVEDIDFYLASLRCFVDDNDDVGTFVVYHKAQKQLEEYRAFINKIAAEQNAHILPELAARKQKNRRLKGAPGSVTISRSTRLFLPRIVTGNAGNSSSLRVPSVSSHSSKSHRASGPRVNSGRWRFRPLFKPQTIRAATFMSSLKSSKTASRVTRTSSFVRKMVSSNPPQEFSLNKSGDGTVSCHVTSMITLADGRFVVLDCTSKTIKLYGSDNRFYCELQLHSSVWDCCMGGHHGLLVTCPAEGRIQRVQVTSNNQLFEAGVILTQRDCRAIAYRRGRIYVTYSGLNPSVKILSKEGIMFKSISATQGKDRIFQNPLYMHVSHDGKLIHISDYTLQRIAAITVKGVVRHVVDVSPNWPLSVTTDKSGNIIFTVSGENEVRLVYQGHQRVIQLVPTSRLDGEPTCVMCKQGVDGQKLYVAAMQKPNIKIFKLLY